MRKSINGLSILTDATLSVSGQVLNGLFSASVKGVKASANLYSLIETAKVNGLEPYAYLRHLFT